MVRIQITLKDKIILKDRIQIEKIKEKIRLRRSFSNCPSQIKRCTHRLGAKVRHRNSPHNLHSNCVSGVTLETIPNLIFCKCLVQIVNGQMNNLFGVI